VAIRHYLQRGCDRGWIGIDAADDVVVLVEGIQEGAVAAVDFEDTRAGTDVEGLGNVLSEREKSRAICQ
jgi:hypothetical protein